MSSEAISVASLAALGASGRAIAQSGISCAGGRRGYYAAGGHGTLFAVHTVRFGIYLRPDQGRQARPPGAASARAPIQQLPDPWLDPGGDVGAVRLRLPRSRSPPSRRQIVPLKAPLSSTAIR